MNLTDIIIITCVILAVCGIIGTKLRAGIIRRKAGAPPSCSCGCDGSYQTCAACPARGESGTERLQ